MNGQGTSSLDSRKSAEAETLLDQFRTSEPSGSRALRLEVSEDIERILSSPGLRKLLKSPTETEAGLQKILSGELPAPEAYPTARSKDKEPPAEFLKRVWGKYIDDGCLYLDQLRAVDPGLVRALYNYDAYYKTESMTGIPPRESRADAYVEGLPKYVVDRIKQAGHALTVRENIQKQREKI